MSNFKFRFFILFCLSILVSPLQAQSTFSDLEPFFINYTTDDGLPSSECHHTIQDQKGYIWIATDNGVSRFDGYGFRNFSADEGLKNNVVFYLQEDREGRIWMLTMSGNLYYYEYATDQIHAYAHNYKIQEYQGKFDWAGPFYIDSLQTAYVGLKNFGILKIKENGEKHLFQTNELAVNLVMEIEGFLVYSIIGSPKFKHKEYEERYVKKNIHPPLEYYMGDSLYKKVYLSKIPGEHNNLILSRIKGSHIFNKRLKNGQLLFQYGGDNALFFKDGKIIRRNALFRIANEKSIIELENGGMLLGESNPGGIYEIENTQRFFAGDKELTRFLSGKYLSSLQMDRQGGLWGTTVKNGIYYFPNYKNKIIDKRIGLASDNIGSIHFRDADNLLFSQGRSQIYELHLPSKKLQPFKYFQGAGTIKRIWESPNNENIWVASGNLMWWNGDKWENMKIGAGGGDFLILDLGKSFTVSRDGQYLWSWGSTSFSKVNIDKKKIEFDARDIGIREPFRTVYEDFSGKTWLGSIRGLFEFKDSTMIPQKDHPAFQVRIEDIKQLKDSTFVIGTKGAGIVFWKGKEFIQLTRKEGLTSNMVENVYVDSLQRIWVGTSEGLNLVKLDENSVPFIKQYTRKHGLPSNEINQVEVSGDDVWVATKKGLIKLPKWEIDTIAVAPRIEKILVNGAPLSNFKQQVTRLKAEQNSLQIEFLTIDYRQHGNIQYRYKLLPSQKEWNYSQNRKLDFSALSNDDYRLEIQSQNRDGYWSQSTVFEFVILPPFWKTWWFVLGTILLGGTILFLWIKRIQREANLVRKMAEAEQFALRSQMNPHFIFNCLASIQGFVSTGEKDKAIRYLFRFSKLIRTSLLFMDKEKITLEEEVAMLTNYLELEKMRYGDKFNYELGAIGICPHY